ncbi:hypothetical protein E2562_011935 [Oryza meyeriana var. granulata]|uniref:Uncharacterized protein n=1 Tax=Oryza meyeriana var. granulata TaxID=110450 RepID=A0A6G1CFD8_9ORYZ|nr:hypothetical protein E2562_011935 [Oryza meyeriana var. granulata]
MAPPLQLVLAASSADAVVATWDVHTGAEAICHRTCASRPRALTIRSPPPPHSPGPRRQLGPHPLVVYYQCDKTSCRQTGGSISFLCKEASPMRATEYVEWRDRSVCPLWLYDMPVCVIMVRQQHMVNFLFSLQSS